MRYKLADYSKTLRESFTKLKLLNSFRYETTQYYHKHERHQLRVLSTPARFITTSTLSMCIVSWNFHSCWDYSMAARKSVYPRDVTVQSVGVCARVYSSWLRRAHPTDLLKYCVCWRCKRCKSSATRASDGAPTRLRDVCIHLPWIADSERTKDNYIRLTIRVDSNRSKVRLSPPTVTCYYYSIL